MNSAALRFLVRLHVCLALLVLPRLAAAQPPADIGPGPADKNKDLTIRLDRTTAHAFEPVYLCLTAEQFATGGEISVAIRHEGEQAWRAVAIRPKDWVRSEPGGAIGMPPLQRRGTILQAENINGIHRWLFPTAGKYQVRVAVGPDSTILPTLTIAEPELGEQQAWESLGDRIGDVLDNPFADQPDQGTIDICVRIMKRFPRSMCAGYCQSYVSISRFKVIFEKNAKSGGKAVYGEIADELGRVARAFRESYFGEMNGFYAGYAAGLAKDFDAVVSVSDGMKTHLTPWSDAATAMKLEVLSHIGPRVVPVDPGQPIPTSQPAAGAALK